MGPTRIFLIILYSFCTVNGYKLIEYDQPLNDNNGSIPSFIQNMANRVSDYVSNASNIVKEMVVEPTNTYDIVPITFPPLNRTGTGRKNVKNSSSTLFTETTKAQSSNGIYNVSTPIAFEYVPEQSVQEYSYLNNNYQDYRDTQQTQDSYENLDSNYDNNYENFEPSTF